MNEKLEDHSGCRADVEEAENRNGDLQRELERVSQELVDVKEANLDQGEVIGDLQHQLDVAGRDLGAMDARCVAQERQIEQGRAVAESLMRQLEIESKWWVELMKLCQNVRLPWFGRPKVSATQIHNLIRARQDEKSAAIVGEQS